MMKNLYNLSCFLLFFSLGLASCQRNGQTAASKAAAAEQVGNITSASTYTNPIYAKDFADPTVVKAADGNFYVYGTNTEVDGETVNIQVAKSSDLVDWEHVGDALPQKPTWADTDFWAPHVLYDGERKIYYLYYSGESNSDTIGKCLGVATATSPTGPFVDRGEALLCGKDFVNIDPMAFDDPATGKKLLFWGSGFEAIKVQELADDRLSFKQGTTPKEMVPAKPTGKPDNYENLIEGAWVVFRNGYYYIYYSGDNCCGDKAHYAVMVARSRNAMGPYETLEQATGKKNSVILELNAQWIAPGHNSIVTDDAGQDWIVYHAIDAEKRKGGRVMLMDKITYRDGWPFIETGAPSTQERQGPIIR